MKKTIFYSTLVASALSITNVASANTSSLFYTEYTTTKNCGAEAVYVGPNLADKHGGICLFPTSRVGDVARIHTSYTTNANSCDTLGGAYGGPRKAGEHGGTCIWIKNITLKSTYTTSKSCSNGSVYVGPNRPDKHGGYCLSAPYNI